MVFIKESQNSMILTKYKNLKSIHIIKIEKIVLLKILDFQWNFEK